MLIVRRRTLIKVETVSRMAGRQIDSGASVAIETERRDQVFVQFEPDSVAGVHARAVDPAGFSCPGLPQRNAESRVVSLKPGEQRPQSAGERGESAIQVGKLVEYRVIPSRIGVIIGCEPIIRTGAQLPIGARSLQTCIEWKKLAIQDTHLVATPRAHEFARELALVLLLAGFSQRPTVEICERGVLHPSPCLGVK